MNDAQCAELISTPDTLSDMETNQNTQSKFHTRKPSEEVMWRDGRRIYATQVDDLFWELENICEERNLKLVSTTGGCEVVSPANQVFDWDIITKFKCEVQSFTDHYLNIIAESDSGKYSAARYAKNLRNAIKMLKSNDELFTACSEKNCDYCEGGN